MVEIYKKKDYFLLRWGLLLVNSEDILGVPKIFSRARLKHKFYIRFLNYGKFRYSQIIAYWVGQVTRNSDKLNI